MLYYVRHDDIFVNKKSTIFSMLIERLYNNIMSISQFTKNTHLVINIFYLGTYEKNML